MKTDTPRTDSLHQGPIAANTDDYRRLCRDLERENNQLRAALQRIADIQNKDYGGDWDEIEEAREIALSALSQ